MTKRTKIAFVCGFEILSANINAGHMRILCLAYELSKQFDVTLVQVVPLLNGCGEYQIHPYLRVVTVSPSKELGRRWNESPDVKKLSFYYYYYYYANLLNDSTFTENMKSVLADVDIIECYWLNPVLIKPLAKGYVSFHNPDVFYDMCRQNLEISVSETFSDADKQRYANEFFEMEKAACEQSDAITVITKEDACRLAELYNISTSKMMVVPVIYDFAKTTFTYPSLRQRSEKYDLRVLWISNYHDSALYVTQKLLDCAKQLPNVEFCFVGAICKMVDKQQTGDNVRSYGFVPTAHLNDMLSSMFDLAVGMSIQTYGMSCKNVEYFSAGIPVITNDLGVRGYEFTDNSCYLYADWDNFAERIIEFIDMPMSERDAMAVRAFKHVKQKFNSKTVSEEMISGWKRIGLLDEQPGVYIFGSGNVGRIAHDTLTYSGVKVEGFIDNIERNHGKIILGTEVFGLNHILQMDERPNIVIAVLSAQVLFNQLLNCDYPVEKITVFNGEEFPGNVDYSRFLNEYSQIASKPKAVIYGTGSNFKKYKEELFKKYNVVALVDGNEKRQGVSCEGMIIFSPRILSWIKYDIVVITPSDATGQEICNNLVSLGVSSITSISQIFENTLTPWTIDPRFFFSNLDLSDKKALFARNVERVCLELNSKCNRQCWFCSNSVVDRHSENHLMSDMMFEKITDELASINYDGDFTLCLFNEPLLRDDFDTKVAAIKEKMPKSLVYTFINGDYLTREWLERLAIAGLDTLYVDIYTQNTPDTVFDTTVVQQKIKSSADALKLGKPIFHKISSDNVEAGVPLFKNMYVCFIANDMTVHAGNRGELLLGLPGIPPREHPKMCIKNFLSVHIDYAGNVWPCPNFIYEYEPHREFIVGNIAEENIFDIYLGQQMSSWREANMFRRDTLPCRSCKWNFGHFVTNSPTREHRGRPASRRPPVISTLTGVL